MDQGNCAEHWTSQINEIADAEQVARLLARQEDRVHNSSSHVYLELILYNLTTGIS